MGTKESFPWRQSGWSVNLNTDLQNGTETIPPVHHMLSWHTELHLYFLLFQSFRNWASLHLTSPFHSFTPSDITLPQLHSIWHHPSTIRHVPNSSPPLSNPPPDSQCMASPTWIQSHFHILLGRPTPNPIWMHFNAFCLVRHNKCCDLPGNTTWG